MAYARFQKPAQDAQGNLIPNVWCEVRREDTAGNPLEPLFSDRLGAVSLSNPFLSASGVPTFHVAGGSYQVRYYASGYDETFRYVGIGLGSERDIQGFTPRGAWSSLTTYSIGDSVTRPDGGGDLHLFASITSDNLNHAPDATTPGDTSDWMYLGPIAGSTEADILTALGITGVIVSEDEPSGGIDGNLWLQI